MRKPNIELNTLKLKQKELQLAQIEAQLAAIQVKYNDVSERLIAKQDEVNALKAIVFPTETVTPAVSE